VPEDYTHHAALPHFSSDAGTTLLAEHLLQSSSSGMRLFISPAGSLTAAGSQPSCVENGQELFQGWPVVAANISF